MMLIKNFNENFFIFCMWVRCITLILSKHKIDMSCAKWCTEAFLFTLNSNGFSFTFFFFFFGGHIIIVTSLHKHNGSIIRCTVRWGNNCWNMLWFIYISHFSGEICCKNLLLILRHNIGICFVRLASLLNFAKYLWQTDTTMG